MRRTKRTWCPILMAAVLATATTARADGFKLPGFSKPRGSSSERVKARVGDEKPQPAKSTWSLPKIPLPSWKLPVPKIPYVTDSKTTRSVANRQPNSPSTWDKMKQGTSNFVNKTTSFLTPWRKKPSPRNSNTVARKPDSSPFSFSSLVPSFGTKKEANDAPTSVRDFLGQPRVGEKRRR